MTKLDWFIARRYLASRKQGRFLSFITWIALGGITVGVTALIVVLGVMNGMQEDLRDKILGSTPHVMVLQHGTALRMDDWPSVVEAVRAMDETVGAAPFIMTNVVISRGADFVQPADLYGVSTALDGTPVTDMEAEIQTGLHSLEPTTSGLPPILVGGRLAERMTIFRGDTLVLYSMENVRIDPFGNPSPAIRQYEVTGTFTTGMYDYDMRNMYAPLDAVQDLLGMGPDQVSGIGVRIRDPWAATEVGREIRDQLGSPYFVESWISTNRSIFAALRLEKLAMTLILFLIVVVAAFNIVSTLVMVVVDRTSEIGILKSMGMTDRQVMRVFMLQGLWIGIIGTVLGSVFGVTISWVLHTYDIIPFPPDIYFLDRLPISLNPLDVLLVMAASVVVAFAATIYPALQASRLQPVEAIRHE